jgi:hypothetical protein
MFSSAHHGHDQVRIDDFIEDPVVPLPHAVLVFSAELLGANRSRVLGEGPELCNNSAAILRRHTLKLLEDLIRRRPKVIRRTPQVNLRPPAPGQEVVILSSGRSKSAAAEFAQRIFASLT